MYSFITYLKTFVDDALERASQPTLNCTKAGDETSPLEATETK